VAAVRALKVAAVPEDLEHQQDLPSVDHSQ
jgi:hypothetical protein